MTELASAMPSPPPPPPQGSAPDMSAMMTMMRRSFDAMLGTFCSHSDTMQCMLDNQADCMPEEPVSGGDDGMDGGDDSGGGLTADTLPCLCGACASATGTYVDFLLESMNLMMSAMMGGFGVAEVSEADMQASAQTLARLQCQMIGAMDCFSANAQCAAVVAEIEGNALMSIGDADNCSAASMPTEPQEWTPMPFDDSSAWLASPAAVSLVGLLMLQ